MAEEIKAHLEGLAQRNAAAGMSTEEARYAAQRRFGRTAQIQEECRDVRGWVWLEQLAKDVRFSVRSLTRSPGYSLAVVTTLAVGIGATTAMVSIARHVLFPAVPFPEPRRMVIVTNPQLSGVRSPAPYPFFTLPYRFAVLHETASSFSALGTQWAQPMNLVVAGEPYWSYVGWVTNDFFAVLGVTPACGRLFLAEEYRGQSGDVAVLSWRTWNEHFEASVRIVGQEISLGGRLRRVVGVLPRGFTVPPGFSLADVYLPAMVSPAPADSRDRLEVVGRLKAGLTLEQAQAEMKLVQYSPAEGLSKRYLERITPQIVPVAAYYQADTSKLFWVFLGAVGLLYVISCSNAVNLMLARLVGRRRELAVRLALGCSQRRVTRLLLSEALALAVGGGAAGLLIAWLSTWAMTPLLPGDAIRFTSRLRIDHPLLVIASGLSVFTCLMVAIIPAGRMRRTRLTDALAEGAGTAGESRRQRHLRNGLVVTQATLATVLLVGMGLTLRSYVRLLRFDYGFDPANKFAVVGRLRRGLSSEAYFQQGEQVRANLARLPHVQNATLASTIPLALASSSVSGAKIDGRSDFLHTRFWYNEVSPEYFATMGVPIIAGRDFTGMKACDPPVVVIDQSAARMCFGKENPIGHYFDLGRGQRLEIVGVVGDVRIYSYRDDNEPQFYLPFWQTLGGSGGVSVLVRTSGRPDAGFEAEVRRAAYAGSPEMVVRLISLSDSARDTLRTERYSMVVLEVLGSLAVALAALGLFAVMAYSVAQRQREFGIRLALGAGPGDLMRLVLGSGLRIAVLGVALGLGVGWGLARFLRSVLYETSPTDPVTFVGVAAALILVAVAACWLPARRASRVDAAKLLRAE